MRVVASSSISREKIQSTHACCFQTVNTFTFSGPPALYGSTMKWKQSVARPRARGVRAVACSVSLMNRLYQKYSIFKMWMLYFQRISLSDYFVLNGDMHQRFEKDAR